MTDGYTLELDIDEVACDALRRDDAVVVVAKPAGNADPNVAWLTLEVVPRTTVSWRESRYGVYASGTAVSGGAVVEFLDRVAPAIDRMTYRFGGGGFGEPVAVAGVPSGHYDVRNETASPATFGLVQSATVNGSEHLSPVHAVVVPPGFTADFAAAAKLYVWVRSRIAAGSIVAPSADVTTIAFDRERRARRCRYDGAMRAFVTDE